MPDLWQRLRWALAVSVVTALVVPFAAGKWTPGVSFGLLLAAWIVASTFVNVRERSRGVRGGIIAQLARQPSSYWGMIVAHLGIAVFIVGVTMVKGYETERDVRMSVGDTVTVGGYTLRFDGTSEAAGPNFSAARGTFDVSRGGQHFTTLFPEKRVYNAGGMPMTEAAIRSMLTGDLYVSLGEPVDGSRVERARLPQALRHLDLGGLPADGAGRSAGAVRPPLSLRVQARSRRGGRRRGAGLGGAMKAATPPQSSNNAVPERMRKAPRIHP